jgi:hypothetical protein
LTQQITAPASASSDVEITQKQYYPGFAPSLPSMVETGFLSRIATSQQLTEKKKENLLSCSRAQKYGYNDTWLGKGQQIGMEHDWWPVSERFL